MLQRVLVSIDGTEYSWRALEYACGLVALSGGELVIMTVTEEGRKQPVIEVDGDCLYAQIGDEVLDAARALMLGKNINCMYLLENSSDVAESILRTVEDEKCDVVVIGSRGLGFLESIFRNSVSQVVLEKIAVPVMIVK